MIRSLLLKLGMLSMTIGVVFWAKWAPYPPVHGVPSTIEKPVVASQSMELEGLDRRIAGLLDRTAQASSLDAAAQTESSTASSHSRIDLNRANAGELESLPGIGAVLAQRVIAFRESVGGFQKIEDLRAVKGIGAKKFERLRSFVMVSAANS